MEVSEQTVIELVKGQATIAQEVRDLKDSFVKVVPYLDARDKELEKSIRSVERKVWYFGGAGTALGFIIEHFGFGKIFGGK